MHTGFNFSFSRGFSRQSPLFGGGAGEGNKRRAQLGLTRALKGREPRPKGVNFQANIRKRE